MTSKINTLAAELATATIVYYVAVELERNGVDGPNAKAHAKATRDAFAFMVDAQNSMAAEAQRMAQEIME